MTTNQTAGVSAEFGYYPEHIEIENDRFSIKTLPNFEEVLTAVKDDLNIHQDWIYSGAKKNMDFSGVTSFLPYNARIFDMPKTHEVTLHRSDNIDDIDFVVWCLSFFTGMRLSKNKNDFLDATPIKKGKLVDFVLSQCTIQDAIELTLDYLESERNHFRATKRVSAVIHALFLAQYPQSLQFERFQYLYMALDGCYQLVKAKANPEIKNDIPHKNRIEWICNQFKIQVPNWALVIEKKSEISIVRNDTMHEALFFDEPLGFSIYDGNQLGSNQGNVIPQMQHLICRLLVCILGRSETDYVKSCINNRLQKSLTL